MTWMFTRPHSGTAVITSFSAGTMGTLALVLKDLVAYVQAPAHANKLPIDLINDNKVFSAAARQSLLDTLRVPGASLRRRLSWRRQ